MSHSYTNRLINEKSPYLLQHAHNPVDWYPWGVEAFSAAKKQDKPVFLSIGYSTCHWCHVMERESFEDEQTAKIINNNYIPVKVDREERPDVDTVYMDVCMAMNRSGGWPLTVIMTPEQKPFYTATYIPKSSRYGLVGLDELLDKISLAWRQDREKLTGSADSVADYIKERSGIEIEPHEPNERLLEKGEELLNSSFDTKHGGFGNAPKFPTPHNLIFLMKRYSLEKSKKTLHTIEKTLEQMYRGGIFDHIGGGFSRYSTDSKWLVPHFEKMLYDNALLLYAYAEAYRITKKELYKYICDRITEYVLRELTHEHGGFFCGQDADSEGVEGRYYVHLPEEIRDVLGENAGKLCSEYDITEKGNFEGKSIPNLLGNKDFENAHKEKKTEFNKLLQFRLKRTRLHKDDKILTAWSSLMIAALCKAYRVFGEEQYLSAAERAYFFIKTNLIGDNCRLKVRWREEDSAGVGKIDDYAFFSWAAIELYAATLNAEHLDTALRTAHTMTEHFFDRENGGFYLYADDAERLITRPKEVYDGAMPSGNSVAALVLVRLSALTADLKIKNAAHKQLSFIAGYIKDYPAGYSFSLMAINELLVPPPDLICVSADDNARREILTVFREKGVEHINAIYKTAENSRMLEKIAPFTVQYDVPKEGVKYYLCRDSACTAPTDNIYNLDLFN